MTSGCRLCRDEGDRWAEVRMRIGVEVDGGRHHLNEAHLEEVRVVVPEVLPLGALLIQLAAAARDTAVCPDVELGHNPGSRHAQFAARVEKRWI